MHETTPSPQAVHDGMDEALTTPYNPTPEEREELIKLYMDGLPDIRMNGLVKGTIVGIGERDVVLDVHWKADTLVSSAEFRDLPDLKIGDEVDLFVERQEDSRGNLVVSRKKALLIQAWETIHKAKATQQILSARVKRLTKGGLVVDLFGIEAFLPGSQVDVRPAVDFDSYVGTTMDVIVLKINLANNNVVVSRRAVMEEAVAKQRKSVLDQLREGQVLEGNIRNITDFGLFVDLGGDLVGLVYIKDIAWKKIDHPKDVLDEQGQPLFEIGKQVRVVVTRADKETGRISLDMKQLTPHPWDDLPEEIKEGDRIRGKVIRFIEHGAVVRITEGVEGLLHNDEVSYSRHSTAREVVEQDQELELMVLTLNRTDRKMYLGLKQLMPDPWEKVDLGKQYAPGTKHTGIVQRVVNVGAYLEFAPGLEGFLHNDNMSWFVAVDEPTEFVALKEKVRVVILEAKKEKRIFEVSLKHMEKSPWDKFEKVFEPGSMHKATVVRKTAKGSIMQLEHGPQIHIVQRELEKKNRQGLKEGEVLDVIVTSFVKDECKILASHLATYDTNRRLQADSSTRLAIKTAEFGDTERETLGDHADLTALDKNWTESQSTPPADTKEDKKL